MLTLINQVFTADERALSGDRNKVTLELMARYPVLIQMLALLFTLFMLAIGQQVGETDQFLHQNVSDCGYTCTNVTPIIPTHNILTSHDRTHQNPLEPKKKKKLY
jgi:hypothetical protein